MANGFALSTKELEELKDVAFGISRIPPLEEWVEIRQKLSPESAVGTQLYWEWLWQSLYAYSSDQSDPLENSGLDESFQAIVQENSNRYIVLSALIFQGEKFLKREAAALGINYSFRRRSELIEELAREEYHHSILLLLQECWESHSEKQRNERLREGQRLIAGEISKGGYHILCNRWHKEDSKLHRDDSLSLAVKPWTWFCLDVFTKYRNKLPAYDNYIASLGIPKYGNVKKFAFIDGAVKHYPGRSRSKRL
jgi:hypothetical protein